ncbi:hypothetical protein ABD87_22755 [Lysinibacillus sphaericus]|uniref:hypothetical protein n=1 Tax=Lysinibacillus sphaericus TaxID=1421 RepID=UPI0018CE70DB|nr:hypothetical protein [Lysinibacillus sphaericus]MBG9732248.1 hypothetical protein [Lysinibacillus sphaericus]
MYLRDYFLLHDDLASVFWDWSKEEQETYLQVLTEWFNDLGKKRTMKRIYNVAISHIEVQEGLYDFLIADVEQFLKAGDNGAFLWIVRRDGTSLIDLNCSRFDSKGNWTSRLYFEALLGYGGRRDYYIYSNEEGFKEVTEDMCFDFISDFEHVAKEQTISEEARLLKVNQIWKQECSDVLKPTRFETKRVRERLKEHSTTTLPQEVEKYEASNDNGTENISFRKARSKSLWDMNQDELNELNETKLSCTSGGQLWFSFDFDING